MSEIRIASRYAKSLIELAGEQSVLEAVYADMQQFVEACAGSRELNTMLKSPVVPADQKRKVLSKAFGSFHSLTLKFADMMVKKGRESFLPLMARQFVALYKERHNIVPAVVTTASPLNEKMQEEIRKVLEQQTGKQIEMTTRIDPSLIGGFVVRMDDKLYDASIVNKFKKLKKELVLN